MRERKDDKSRLNLPLYESYPAPWLPRVHASADLGYAGFHPPRPGQDEDVLSAANVKHGFILAHPVLAETFSAQSMINENIHTNPDAMSKLEDLMNEVFIRRAEHLPAVPPSTFRMPSRVTLNDTKRLAWFSDLADPDVPLHKLGKSVPHGAKGHDLLDLLQSNNVAISRAVWFLRVFGANETAGLRNKPTYNPTQYSIEWATTVTGYLKKQLSDIALPSAPRPGLNIKQTFKGVLADSDSRERWTSRFIYCLKLLRSFYAEGLIDHRTFLVWLVQQVGSCNLAQVGFIIRLADEYLDDIVTSRALSRCLVDACLSKHAEICSTAAQELLSNTEDLLKTILQRICLAMPDAFVGPRLWTTHSTLLDSVMAESVMSHSNDRYMEQNIQDIQQLLLNNFFDIKRRNEAMLFLHPLVRVSARLGTAVSDVKLLNSISSDTDMASISFFANEIHDTSCFKEKLDLLLTWSVTPLQFGDHRPFAAVTLIRKWRDQACDRASRRDFSNPNEFLQDMLFDWIDTSDVAGEHTNIRSVALVYGKLVKHELFSYASYIQRLIAREEPGITNSKDVDSRHRRFLSWIPLFNATSSLNNQRKVTLYGVRAREIPEDLIEREIRQEIRLILPEVFGGDTRCVVASTAELLSHCRTLVTASRFVQVRTFRQWLLPLLRKHIANHDPNDRNIPLLKAYSLSVELMASAKCFHSALDLTLFTLKYATSAELLAGVIDSLYRYAVIWTCMAIKPEIVDALNSAHQLWKTRGAQSRPLLELLIEFEQGRYLPEAARERIVADMAIFTHALQPTGNRRESVPDVLPEILLLAGDPDAHAPSILADGLWIKYRTSNDWGWKVWDNTVASLRQVPTMTSDVSGRRICALRYGTFLLHVDQHMPHGVDADVLRWFLGPGKSEVAALNVDTWDILTVVLSYLSVHGALKTTTIMRGLVYPAWQLGAPSSSSGRVPEVYLRAANTLCQQLLLQEVGSGDEVLPVDIFDIQHLHTRRQAVYHEAHFLLLSANIPVLIALESNENISQDLRDETTSLRTRLCRDQAFRQGAYRNLDVIREAFENSPQLMDTTSETLSKHTMAGLRMILHESGNDSELYDWPEVSCLLSPWKIAATTIQMQFIIKQLGRALVQESTHEVASADLDRLTLMLLQHIKTPEEAYYVAEMARGADSTVAGKFINNGLKYIIQTFSESLHDGDHPSTDSFKRVGELLRVLVYAAQPFREDQAMMPVIDSSVQDAFMEALCAQILSFEGRLDAEPVDDRIDDTQDIVLVARLLQFVLGFRATCTSKMRASMKTLSVMLFKLALYFGTGDRVDLPAYALLIDTLLYLYDELPPESAVSGFDPFHCYPDISPFDLPPDLPSEYRRQIFSLLPILPASDTVSDLVTSHKDQQGNIVYGNAVANRPWEWIENLGEPSVLDPKEEEKEREEKERLKVKHLVKNSGSLSLDNFGARLTGDGIVRNYDAGWDSRTEGNIRTFEDGLSGDTVFIRDWRESRIDLEPDDSPRSGTGFKPDPVQDHEANPLDVIIPKAERRPTPRGSPASSVVSRTSARGSTSSVRQSPSQGPLNRLSSSTISEVIDVDNVVTSGKESGKRKAAVISDDEVEIMDGPVEPRAGTSVKKARTKAAPKPKGKKK